jgi:hypothetical protein
MDVEMSRHEVPEWELLQPTIEPAWGPTFSCQSFDGDGLSLLWPAASLS